MMLPTFQYYSTFQITVVVDMIAMRHDSIKHLLPRPMSNGTKQHIFVKGLRTWNARGPSTGMALAAAKADGAVILMRKVALFVKVVDMGVSGNE
jgi:hypothetical protein